MSMSEWAERECRIACGRENKDFDFDSDEFDYGCSCYKSALKAYKSLMEDGHSGMSFGFTKNILVRLMDGLPLTPITDEDFFKGENLRCLEDEEYLKEQGLKSNIQCPRMTSLFRYETLDGKVTYHDVDRAYFVDIEEPLDTYSSNDSFLDEMFPITMPYMPKEGKYVIYAQTFLTDRKNGDYDTRGIMYVVTPDGKRVELGLYYTVMDGKWTQITKAQYEELLEKRIDKLSVKVADKLIWTLLNYFWDGEERARRNIAYNKKSDEWKVRVRNYLIELCEFFDKDDNYKWNTSKTIERLCFDAADGLINESYKDVKPLEDITSHLRVILETLHNTIVSDDEVKEYLKKKF